MEDICRVEGLQRAEGLEKEKEISGKRRGMCIGIDLVYEVLAMVIRELLGANYAVHIRLHEFLKTEVGTRRMSDPRKTPKKKKKRGK